MSYYPTQQGFQPATHTVVVNPNRDKTGEVYNAKTSIGLGAVQIVVALLCFVFGAAVWPLQEGRQSSYIAYYFYTSYDNVNYRLNTGASIWCGLFFLISGSIAVAAGKQRNTGLIVAAMVMSIISTLSAFSLMIHMALSTADEASRDYSYTNVTTADTVSLAISAILVALAVIEIIVAIWTSALYCATCCCDSTVPSGYSNHGNAATTVVIQHQHYNQTPGQAGPYQPQPQGMYPMGQHQGQPSWAGGAAQGQQHQQAWASQPPAGTATYTTQQGGTDVHMPAAPPPYPPPAEQKY